jgi:hypothetical protein
MLKRQFSLLAIATLLLSPTLVHADEIGESMNISAGNVRIQTDEYGFAKIQTPNVNITTTQPFATRWLISSRKRRIRPSVRKPIVKKQTDYFCTICSQSTTNRTTTNLTTVNLTTTDLTTSKQFYQSICRQSDFNNSEFFHNLK